MAHHERWDGSGYPDGKRADEIPFCAWIVALCDVCSALREPRPYKESLSHQDAIDAILHGKVAGNGLGADQFDPDLIWIVKGDPDVFHIDFRAQHAQVGQVGQVGQREAPTAREDAAI